MRSTLIIASTLGLLSCATVGADSQVDEVLEPEFESLYLTVGDEDEVCDAECESLGIDPMMSLVVTEPEILDRFPIRKVLEQLIGMSGAANDADGLWKQWWASQRPGNLGDPPHWPFCDDNGGTINGWPIECPRDESVLQGEVMETHTPTALVNRFDLAPMDGAHCGEYRIVYAKDGQAIPAEIPNDPIAQGGRNFIIFEGVLPNPHPECGLSGCLQVAQFWQALSSEPDVGVRADHLEKFYFEGICDYEPVITPEHYGLECEGGGGYGGACGQIRTNQFFQAPWLLKEFQLSMDAGDLLVSPVTVKSNPHVELFTGFDSGFNSNYSSSIDSLLPNPDGINFLALTTDPKFDAGESPAQGGGPFPANQYFTSPGSGLETDTNNALIAKYGGLFPTAPLTLGELDARATTQSCGGCHQLSVGAFLGSSVSGGAPLPAWPGTLGFVHIDEFSNLSPALTDPGMFLDHREDVLLDFLATACGEDCLGPDAGLAVIKPPELSLESSLNDETPLATFEIVSIDEAQSLVERGDVRAFDTLSGHLTH